MLIVHRKCQNICKIGKTGDLTEMSKTSTKVAESCKNIRFFFEKKLDDNKIVVQVTGKSKVVRDDDRYFSVYPPYATYHSVSALARKVADVVPRL
jgi:hypothetical protein